MRCTIQKNGHRSGTPNSMGALRGASGPSPIGRAAITGSKWLAVAVGFFLLTTSEVSRADQDGFGDDFEGESETGLELGVRVGYGVGLGKTTDSSAIQHRMTGALPIGFDLGVRVHPRWFVGGYGEYAVGHSSATLNTSCDDCTNTWLHLSLAVQYRLLMRDPMDLWIGLGTGRHWLNSTLEPLRNDLPPHNVLREQSRVFSGPEFVTFHFGGNFEPTEGIAVGPFSALSLGAFSEAEESCSGLCPTERRKLDVSDSSMHVWFRTGLRVVFLP